MILKETILSAFTERGTLLKWLKKVEAALNNAVLTDISLEQISATQVKLKFTFENGDSVESPVLTLPRGEKGEKGEKGEDGKDGLDGEGIAATIEIGTVTTGAAGTDANVTNVGTEQRAILNFVIPRGEQGSAGVGFDEASHIEQNSGENTLTAGADGLNIAATFKVTAGGEVFEIPSSMFLAVKGSESIVIDVDESGDFIDIHLDADITAKLQRVLVTPTTAPASVSLVAVDTSNAQTLLTLGSGLSVSGGVLSASGGGGGGSRGVSITIGAQITPSTVFFADGTSTNAVQNSYSNVVAIRCRINVPSAGGIWGRPLGIYSLYENSAFSDLRYAPPTLDPNATYDVMYFPLVDGVFKIEGGGGGLD